LGVPFDSGRVALETTGGQSIEAAARDARYAMLAGLMEPGELLLTAHHRDDQLETVMLRLLRGSGVRGLRGIAPYRPFGPGGLARPMLELSKDELRHSADLWGLNWIEDPSNPDLRFDRNYLRSEVLPQLRRRWPSAAVTVSRAARQMTAAQEILDEIAGADSSGIETPERISLPSLREIPESRRANLLRFLIAELGLNVPNARQLKQLLAAIDVTRADAQTQVQWPGAEARVFREHLYLFEPLAAASAPDYVGRLGVDAHWKGPEGRLELCPSEGAGLSAACVENGLTVRFRIGGERFKPLGSAHSRTLKKWLQLAGVVPWMRARIPLLYRESTLVAVADLWLSDEARDAAGDGPAWRVAWSDHPPLQ
jgi:tRNA(Ile)-lysidine synthase